MRAEQHYPVFTTEPGPNETGADNPLAREAHGLGRELVIMAD